LKYVLMHQLAHLRRWDDWTNLIQKVVRALLFFHPAVWWIERKLALDREMACDDVVLAESPSARDYAECLANVAEKGFMRRQLAMAQAAVHRMKHLTLRVARILDDRAPKTTRLWKPAGPLVTAAVGLCAFWTSQAPPLVSIVDSPAIQAESSIAPNVVAAA